MDDFDKLARNLNSAAELLVTIGFAVGFVFGMIFTSLLGSAVRAWYGA